MPRAIPICSAQLAWGYQKLAAVLGNTSQSNVGDIDAADKSLHKAIALFEAVYKANPGSVDDGLNLSAYPPAHRRIGYLLPGRSPADHTCRTDPGSTRAAAT